MVWHDCKTDPPKKSGFYLLVYEYFKSLDGKHGVFNTIYDRAFYEKGKWSLWEKEYWRNLNELFNELSEIKWAEVDLSEVE